MMSTLMPRGFLFLALFALTINANAEKSITVQFGSEPTQFDPLIIEDGAGLRLAANVIATPFEYDGAGKLVKSLASDFSLSKNKKTITLRFKKNLKWSDGVLFHADQFIAALERLVNEPVKAALSQFFPVIDLSKTKALDAETVQIELKSADAMFMQWLTLPPFSPIRADVMQKISKRNPVVPTLAAYEIIQYRREDFLVLKKNQHYFDAKNIEIDQVKVRFLKDESSYYPMLKTGAVDILFGVPVLQLDQIRAIANISEVPVEAVTYYGLNTKKPPFNELKNRRAFRDAHLGKMNELASILRTGELAAVPFIPAILTPKGAKMMPIPKKEKPAENLEFRIQSNSGSRNQTMLEFSQNQVKKEYRWKAKLEMMEWKAHYSRIKTDVMEVFRFGWQNPISHPYIMYQVLMSKSINNFTGWSNAEYDQLVNELREETSLKKQAELVTKIENIIADEVPVVPLLHQVLRFASSKRVIGFRANSFGVILFRELKVLKN